MTIHCETLKNWAFPEVRQAYGWKDTALYALGIGLGADPLARDELRFVYEPWLEALPTMAAVLAGPGFWIRDPATGIDWQNALHGEQEIVLHRPLPATGTVIGRTQVDSLIDRGAGKGAILTTRTDLHDAATDELIASVFATAFARNDGGFGGPAGTRPAVHPTPDRAPDHVVDLPTLPQAALLYRLNGDDNPLHAEPEAATHTPFGGTIAHGCVPMEPIFQAVQTLLALPRLPQGTRMSLRYLRPSRPGDTIHVEGMATAAGASALPASTSTATRCSKAPARCRQPDLQRGNGKEKPGAAKRPGFSAFRRPISRGRPRRRP